MRIEFRDKGIPMTADEMYETLYGKELDDGYSSFISRRDLKWSAGNATNNADDIKTRAGGDDVQLKRDKHPRKFKVSLGFDV